MARLYADEQFPQKVSELLRKMGHDVLTVQEAGILLLKLLSGEIRVKETKKIVETVI